MRSMTLETGIFLSQAIWLWRVRHVRREAKQAGKTYDEYVAEHPSKKFARSESSETIVDVEACHNNSQGTPTAREKCKEKPSIEAVSEDMTQPDTPSRPTCSDNVSAPEKSVQPARCG